MQRRSWRLVTFANLNLCVVNVRQNLGRRRPECVSLREESNSRTTFRFKALVMPVRANIVGPPSAPRILHISAKLFIQRPVRFERTIDFIKRDGAARQD
jgi:hypothetical protein